MGKKKSNGGDGEIKSTANDGGGDGKKDDSILTVVLKLDMHCEGCSTKIKKFVRSFHGVEMVKGEDGDLTKLTVMGKVDPAKLREAVEKEAKKKVQLISPPTSNEENSNGNHGGAEKKKGAGGEASNNKQGEKEPPVTTGVMKLNLHCDGCIQKIRKIVTKTKGYSDMSIDVGKGQITVKGTMDMKALAHSLADKLRTTVDIVPPKKEAEKKENSGDSEKGKSGGNGDNSNGGGQNLIQYVEYGYPNQAVFGYGYGYPVEQLHASQMFSDENPNACFVM